MALCNRCKKEETDLYIAGTPICAKCDEEIEGAGNLLRATADILESEIQTQPEQP
jgi:hypothetical protein